MVYLIYFIFLIRDKFFDFKMSNKIIGIKFFKFDNLTYIVVPPARSTLKDLRKLFL